MEGEPSGVQGLAADGSGDAGGASGSGGAVSGGLTGDAGVGVSGDEAVRRYQAVEAMLVEAGGVIPSRRKPSPARPGP